MKEEKFKIIQFIRELIIRIEKELDNFPKKDIEIKSRIRNTTYDLLETSYYANTTQNVDLKIRLMENIIAKIKTLDFLLNLSLDRELITGKKYIKLGDKLNDIAKYTNGWLSKLTENDKNWKLRKNTNGENDLGNEDRA